MTSDDQDDVTRAADKAIKHRAEQLRTVQSAELSTSIGLAMMEDLTRIRFELSAVRRLLERVAGKL